MITPRCFIIIMVAALVFVVLYILSIACCRHIFDEKNIDSNIITFLITAIPILNFVMAIKAVNWKKLKDDIFRNQKDRYKNDDCTYCYFSNSFYCTVLCKCILLQ